MTANPRDITVREIKVGFKDYGYRSPMKFGGRIVTGVTLSDVEMRVADRNGNESAGTGSMVLGNTWSFPSDILGYDETLNAMKVLSGRISAIIESHGGFGHPVEIITDIEDMFLRAATEVAGNLNLPEPIPKLCALVAASPFDAALHDAYGKLHNLNVYNAYGEGFMNRDLSHYLTDEFTGEYLDRYTLRNPKKRMPLYHLVGALDPITDSDVSVRINDGLPNTLPEWIEYNGLTHFKLKLDGNDLPWDIDRVLTVDRATAETQEKRGVSQWFYSADFNERCEDVQYLLEFLKRLKEANSSCFDRIQYIEQPTSRNLRRRDEERMHEAAKLKPVVIDEALVDFDHLRLSMDLGYSGVALKTCKGQSNALLMGAAALKYNLFLCVQDLTLPGASFLHSAGLCARVPGVAAIEGNGRQYCPSANAGWEEKWPSVFKVTDGTLGLSVLTLPGLGH